MSLTSRLAAGVSARSRATKAAWLRARIPESSTVLLVGVSAMTEWATETDNQVERELVSFTRAEALVYEEGDPGLGVPTTRGDACDLPFDDDAFDFVVSNAVIEHVGGPERARAMLAESVRVARRGAFHTTPDRAFPVEVHTRLPLLHWLPRRWQQRAFARAGRAYWTTDYYWLFTRRSFSALDRRFTVHRTSPMTLVAAWTPEGGTGS